MIPECLSEWYSKAARRGYKKTESEWKDERFRAQTDLFWFAKEVLGYDLVDNYFCSVHPGEMSDAQVSCAVCDPMGRGTAPMEPYWRGPVGSLFPEGSSPHREMCNFFVRKNPNLSLYAQDTVKDRLLLVPRSGFKSSIDAADCAQWIVAFPNVRVAVLSAGEDLSVAFVDEVKKFFVVPQDKDGAAPETRTRFQLLFPEHCVLENAKGPSGEFTTPARTQKGIKDPSLHAISLGKHTSGWHYDVGKYDDCESNKNSGPGTTAEQRDTVRKAIGLARSLIVPSGFHDNLGTPYHGQDAYSHQVEHSDPDKLRLLRKPAWALKEGSRRKPEEELGEADYNLFFPWFYKQSEQAVVTHLTYGYIRKAFNDDPGLAECQLLCQPSSAKTVKFTEHLLRSHITQSEGLPQPGTFRTFSAWDLAYSVESGRDFTIGAVGYVNSLGCLFVVELIMGRFGDSELPFKIADQVARWRVERVGIEKPPVAELLHNEIVRELGRLGHLDCTVEFIPVDTKANAKNRRAESLETLLVQDRLWFWSAIPIMETVIKQFTRFKPHSKRKDDIVDAVAHLARFLPAGADIPQNERERREALEAEYRRKVEHELVFPDRPFPPPREPVFVMPMEWDGEHGRGPVVSADPYTGL